MGEATVDEAVQQEAMDEVEPEELAASTTRVAALQQAGEEGREAKEAMTATIEQLSKQLDAAQEAANAQVAKAKRLAGR